MIIKVISLKKSRDRKRHIHQEFLKLGLSYDFEDGIDPSLSSKKILNLFSKKKFKLRYGRLPILGEIGCSISHYLVLKKFLHIKNERILAVIEDDAKINCTKEELFSVSKVFEKSKFDILILGFSKCNDKYERHINIINPILPIFKVKNKISIGPRYLSSTSGSIGYLVKKKSAKTMSDILPISILADDWGYFSKIGLKIAYTKPMIIRENFIKLSSTMNHANNSLNYKESGNFIIKFLLFSRKHIIGFSRFLLLFLKFKFK